MPGLDRKPQILDAASQLLQSRSFTAFSYQDLSERLSISKASIHHHFSTKEDLLRALGERYRDRQRLRLREIEKANETPTERLDALLELMERIAHSGDKICPLGALQSEFNVIPPSAREVVRELFEFPKLWLSEILAEGRRRGEMSFEGEPRERAVLILAAVQGALQIARVHGTVEFDGVVRQIRAGVAVQAQQPERSPNCDKGGATENAPKKQSFDQERRKPDASIVSSKERA